MKILANRVNSLKGYILNSRYKKNSNKLELGSYGRICGTYMTYMRRKAKERNLVWELDPKYLFELYTLQNGKCAITGIDIHLSTTINTQNNLDRTLHTASLDRIDNSVGYVIGNVQWVHKTINKIRRDLSVQDFVFWCTLVSKHANNEPNLVNDQE